ncbi:hypothetical protein F2P81_007740 [Scophthalmus maximus]|uniref:Uncharacterized protein n=1 Tax=Scophthalmus maximus TaxID=52904 RepID=A0A6A4T316_SCOMX|nr:hypothetical protein F2P81_007740 [Scophthalmus maximus]
MRNVCCQHGSHERCYPSYCAHDIPDTTFNTYMVCPFGHETAFNHCVQSPGDKYQSDLFSSSQSRIALLSDLTLGDAKPDEDLGDVHSQTVLKSTIRISIFSNPLNVIHF